MHMRSFQYTGVEEVIVDMKADFEVNWEFIEIPKDLY